MDNADRFLRALTEIEVFLRNKLERSGSSDRHLDFKPMIDASTKRLSPAQRTNLKRYVDLRNAIVHEPRDSRGVAIASPRDDVVEWVESQLQIITNPPKVMSVLKLQKPRVLSEYDNIMQFLEIVRTLDYSQSPVRDEAGSLWLVTTNAVTRWLSSLYEVGAGALLDSTSVGSMKEFTEAGDALEVKHKSLTAVEAVRIFAGESGRIAPAAIILTESGNRNETPLGICSRADVADLLHSLGV